MCSSDLPFGSSAAQLYQKASLQEKGSLVDTTQFKASQTIKKQNIDEEIEDDLNQFEEAPTQNATDDPQSKTDSFENSTNSVKKQELEEDEDDEDFDLDDADFNLEDDFDSVNIQKSNTKNKITATKKTKDNLTPPDYSKIAQEVKVKKSGIKK